MLLSKKIIIKNINYELLDDKNSNIAENINERINENQIKNIKKYQSQITLIVYYKI